MSRWPASCTASIRCDYERRSCRHPRRWLHGLLLVQVCKQAGARVILISRSPASSNWRENWAPMPSSTWSRRARARGRSAN